VIVATGMSVRRLAVPGEERFYGAGVYYGASLTEAANYRSKNVMVVGGGNSAGQAAMWFSRFASHVSVAIRRDSLVETMSKYLIDRIGATKNVEVLGCTEVAEVCGKERLEHVVLKDSRSGAKREAEVSALFIFIGQKPHSEFLKGAVALDERGFVLTGSDHGTEGHRPKGWSRDPLLFETSVAGVFAVGDVRAGSSKRVAAAVGEGSGAVSSVHAYLKEV
jgi:thioredoxin reductase (NADPH)